MAEIVVQVLVDPLLVRQDDAAEAAPLAVDMLGRRIDDDMGAELQRLLLQGRGEDVVDDQPRSDRIGKRSDSGDVDHFQRRIGRAFKEEQLGVGPDRLFPVGDVGAVDQRRLDAVFRRQRLDHPAAGAEQRARRHDMVAGLGAAQKCRGHRRHARCRGARILGAFQRAHALFEHVDGGIGVARIDEARLLALEAGFRRLRRLVDIALGEVHRLGGFAEAGTQRSGVHECCLRLPVALLGAHRSCSRHKKTGRESRNRSIRPCGPTVL